MTIIIALVFILVLSFLLALISMKDYHTPQEVRKMLERKKIRGTLMFTKQKVKHYSSSASSGSSVS